MVFIRSASTVIPPVRSSKKSGTLQELASANNSAKKTMMKILNALKGNKSGASAAEYALIVAVLGGFVVLGCDRFRWFAAERHDPDRYGSRRRSFDQLLIGLRPPAGASALAGGQFPAFVPALFFVGSSCSGEALQTPRSCAGNAQ